MKKFSLIALCICLSASAAYASTYECGEFNNPRRSLTMTPSADQTQIQLVRGSSKFTFDLDTTPESEPYRNYAGISDDEPTFGFILTAIPSKDPFPAEFDCSINFRKKVAPGQYVDEPGNYHCKARN